MVAYEYCMLITTTGLVSTMQSSQITAKGDITVFDSSSSHLSKAVKALLATQMRTPRKKLHNKIVNVIEQAGYSDCGVFAAPYCTACALANK